MSAADMFVRNGEDFARPNSGISKKTSKATANLFGSTLTAIAVLLATQLQGSGSVHAKEKDQEDKDTDTPPGVVPPDASDGIDTFTVSSILGSLDEDTGETNSIEVAAAGDYRSGPESSETVSEQHGFPKDIITQSPEVTDPYVEAGRASDFRSANAPIDPNTQSNLGTTANFTTELSESIADVASDAGPQSENDTATSLRISTDLLQSSGLVAMLLALGMELNDMPNGMTEVVATDEQIILLMESAAELVNQSMILGNTGPLALEGTAATDTLSAGSGDDQIHGLDGDDFLSGLGGGDLLDGGSGFDTADYSLSPESVFIDLDNGSAAGGDAQGDRLVSIENLVGSGFDDGLLGDAEANSLFGEDGADHLFGSDGDDFLSGGAGSDIIDGGDGVSDTASYFESDAAVIVSLLDDTADGGHATGDELDNIENLNGSLFDDFLEGDANDNRLGGHHGEDVLLGLGGNDTLLGGNLGDLLDGGEGVDTADYTASTSGVSVNLKTGNNSGGEAEGDTLVSIENLAGSAHNDVLVGDDQDNRLTGRDGDDHLFGDAGNDRLVGGLGSDHLDGGEGNRDAADYSNAAEAVGLTLFGGGFLGEAEGDTFAGIEFVVGSDFNDQISGDDGINRLDGGDGDDFLSGEEGNDTLIGGSGNDILSGGDGNDVFIFTSDSGEDLITDFEAGAGRTDRIWLRDHGFGEFDDVLAISSDITNGTLITFDNDTSLLLEGIQVTDLVQDDFILA